ncbi:hypothetical protein FOZ60_017347 [Perkinsus olseni]|uniref:Uncharacterized protein n=1 Tax=Perkinsus olseni TaxID=32597 RepID=A0A7J6N0Q2_PEROL|nr:hypothetical protein FOZ60_017347 [Perkinsus olseni]
MLEGLMVEIGAGKIFPGQVYSPYATTRILCYNKLIESFGDCLNVVNAANEIAGSSGYQIGCRSLDKVKALGANGLYKATSRRGNPIFSAGFTNAADGLGYFDNLRDLQRLMNH